MLKKAIIRILPWHLHPRILHTDRDYPLNRAVGAYCPATRSPESFSTGCSRGSMSCGAQARNTQQPWSQDPRGDCRLSSQHHLMKHCKLPSYFLALVVIAHAGCLKYTPSHTELRKRYQENHGSLDSLGGEEEFKRYEATLRTRLESLITERSHLLDPAAAASGHPLGVGDELQVAVYGFGDLSSNSAVSNDGQVILPLVGRVPVVGHPLEQVQSEISRRYAHFIRSPQVRVTMKTPVTNRVTVTGEVHKPGPYPILRKRTLLSEVLAEAGGRTPLASSRIILLPAPRILGYPPEAGPAHPSLSLVGTPPSEEISGVEIDTEDLIGNVNQRPILIPLLPGDTIIVPEAGTYEVDGEVVQPGSFKLTSRTSVIGAIAAAQGFTYSAAVNRVEVIRDTGGGQKALLALDLEEVGLRGGQDVRLRNGDLVRVPSEPGRFFKRQVVETINGLFNGVGVNKRVN